MLSLKKIFGTQNERELKKLQPVVDEVNSLEPEMTKLSDEGLRKKTDEFREIIKKKQDELQPQINEIHSQLSETTDPTQKNKLKVKLKEAQNKIFDEALPKGFAVAREAARRAINMRHFDSQILGGIILHQGRIAEMATGEGKTLVATLPAYLNALLGRGVHIVTVNDYLAKRDREWMGPVYEFLGLSVGVIQHDMSPQDRKIAYDCDITYGTNNEFGFDYLRDNFNTFSKEELAQREFYYAIVDEVDSILVDEARTPLIISGPAEESTDKYYKIDRIIPRLAEGKRDETTKQETGDFIVDEKTHAAYLTEEGEKKTAQILGLSDLHTIESMEYKHHINKALMAHHLYKRDDDYVVKDGQVFIVDEFTGRLMPGRRWSDGLHQAIEAKENCKIERENQTLATITLQNYFRMYEKLAGMTGTAYTEAMEFIKIYNLDVAVIPTNRPLIRTTYSDCIYKSKKEKFKAVADEIARLYEEKRPVLVGTISIENNEKLSAMLKSRGIPHQVLNAKYHEFEARIIAQAGRLAAVTVATNMAGRGTDILLGGNPEFMAKDLLDKKKASGYSVTDEEYKSTLEEMKKRFEEEHKKVVELGGLHILGTERHEARRIDNQLRGRAGRQGDPGSSQFFISLEDDLMRIFGSERIARFMDRLGMEEGQEIKHPLISRAIETAQKRVEQHNFDIRKHVLEYDNVMNKQRELIYSERKMVLESDDLKGHIFEMIEEILDAALNKYLNEELPEDDKDYPAFCDWLKNKFLILVNKENLYGKNIEQLKNECLDNIKNAYEQKEKNISKERMAHLQKFVLLQAMDSKWKDHLYNMDHLREGIGLRAYGQMDPLIEYQHEAYDMFMDMVLNIKEEAIEFIFNLFPAEEIVREMPVSRGAPIRLLHREINQFGELPQAQSAGPAQRPKSRPAPEREGQASQTFHRQTPKVGRNDPCPCGSNKKFKKCCGR